ncbi:hydroxyisourate hydrolase [Paenibacillus sp. sgz302251]|uniref:hydroxyisourate hydrolase n=1 Tax=Paenibacillus sp. sgz302251 TaxID=3414493 RepID=UPI003C7A42A2
MMSGRITTHVLDIAGGKPGAGMTVELWYLGESVDSVAETPVFLGSFITNQDGRVDQPLLEGEALQNGAYKLIFAAGDYYRREAHLAAIAQSLFEVILIQFHIHDKSSHYHVPLLVSPGGYSTYRGS